MYIYALFDVFKCKISKGAKIPLFLLGDNRNSQKGQDKLFLYIH